MWKWNTVCHAAGPQRVDQVHAGSAEPIADAERQALSGRGDGGQLVGLDLPEVGGVPLRDHQRVSAGGRRDVHEGERLLVLVTMISAGISPATILQKMQSSGIGAAA